MNLEALVIEKLRQLPEEKAQEVLNFADWMVQKEMAEEQADYEAAIESLQEGGVPIPYDQIRRELGLGITRLVQVLAIGHRGEIYR